VDGEYGTISVESSCRGIQAGVYAGILIDQTTIFPIHIQMDQTNLHITRQTRPSTHIFLMRRVAPIKGWDFNPKPGVGELQHHEDPNI